MSHKLEVLRQLGRVEFVDPNFFVILASKKMTSVRKHDLSALLDGKWLVGHELPVKNVHHSDTVAEADNKLQARGMKRNRVSLLIR